MKNNIIEHKGYYGSIDYSAEDNVLFSSVIGTGGLISYEGRSIDELKEDFEEAVDSYLEMCEADGVEHKKYYKVLLPQNNQIVITADNNLIY